tara:strand:+ start:25511 stop:26962 length:1452 start_codon:yes stop_codon:yes gene_type:complete
MKTSASKILKQWFDKKKLDKRIILSAIITLLILVTLIFFGRPYFYNFDSNRISLEKSVNKAFKIDTKFKGKISYQFFPSPRLKFENAKLIFNKENKDNTTIKELFILISPLELGSIKNFDLRKILILNQRIKINTNSFGKYFKYLTILDKRNIDLKNCEIFFEDKKKEEVNFNKVNFNEKINNKMHSISLDGYFSERKIKIDFKDEFNKKKFLKAKIPEIGATLDIFFDKETTLDKLVGNLKFALLDNILMLNFNGRKDFDVKESYFKNKFLNSKVDGKIRFKDNFNFDLALGINQISLRKFLLYYFSNKDNEYQNIQSISKKFNGKLNILSQGANSFFGKIKKTKMLMNFENGDLSVKNGLIEFSNNNSLKFDFLITSKNNESQLDFSLDFNLQNTDKFLNKFDVYNLKDKKYKLFANGKINLNDKKIFFKNIIKNENEKVSQGEIIQIQKNFNKFVIDKSVIDIFDFFKIKKFVKETSLEF